MPHDPRLTEAAYQGPVLEVDRDFYSAIGEQTELRRVVEEFPMPIRSGQAWDVPTGNVRRISTVDGTRPRTSSAIGPNPSHRSTAVSTG